MEIIQVVGYKNSGKTTFAQQIIHHFSSRGLKTASLKHHGHGGTPDVVENKDSTKHHEAGAIMTGVEGDGMIQLNIDYVMDDFDRLLAFYRVLDVDVLVVEGYKKLDFNKIVMIKGEEDLHLLEELTNIKAAIASIHIKNKNYPFPIYDSQQHKEVIDRINQDIRLTP
ncbi:molybdopterin-guanine dinucleotide biosynthesis protein B [Aquibacillus albus]|uniref:Molybdopterin-guanine dinucleotide biosynthesis protein B n=1 Tax=Aquibacillus albus TaxID=1168171 RepID=A0ABS2MZ43_9BACI|nr:molybdopterin-guanine dinucleotide biosynthesis protein B [Aquibacillus albus]MBM7570945.1 molybdopterin-guanine dinucleotide biosynthesis protein B [Aquibacillus albus]